jgi:N-acetylneuraminate synthase
MSALHPDVLVIAEVAAAPEGWWTGVAASARAAAEAGVNAVRVDPPRSLPSASAEGWIALRKAVLRSDVDFLVTVSRPEDVSLLRRVGVGGLAASVANDGGEGFWEALGAAHLPLFLLCDGDTEEPMRRALAILDRYDVGVTVIFGQADRPASPERLGLGRLHEVELGGRVSRGFADRSGTGWPVLAACFLGADALEIPLSLSPYLPEPAGALDPGGLRRAVEGLRYLAWVRAHPRAP